MIILDKPLEKLFYVFIKYLWLMGWNPLNVYSICCGEQWMGMCSTIHNNDSACCEWGKRTSLWVQEREKLFYTSHASCWCLLGLTVLYPLLETISSDRCGLVVLYCSGLHLTEPVCLTGSQMNLRESGDLRSQGQYMFLLHWLQLDDSSFCYYETNGVVAAMIHYQHYCFSCL